MLRLPVLPTSTEQVMGDVWLPVTLAVIIVFLSYEFYVTKYFEGDEFAAIKSSIVQHTNNCNDLNSHIEILKSTHCNISRFDYGQGSLSDSSKYSMKRRKWQEEDKNARTHNCSASVCKNASDQPFKYLCKYFDIEVSEDTLSNFENVLNNFSAAEQGKILLQNQRDSIVSSIENSIPPAVLLLKRNRLVRELGFTHIDLSDLYFPIYTFQHVSPGGNSASRCDIKLDVQNLDKFATYLCGKVSFRKSIAGQRALMTSTLRDKIKNRDNFTCQICRLSIVDEKNLLLEIDHIVPLSKGGITCENNLQTLCWKCNRAKGAKILHLSQDTA
jgi:HNH endonuclease